MKTGNKVRFDWEGHACEGVVETVADNIYVRPTAGEILSEYPWNDEPSTPVILDPDEVQVVA